MTADDYADLARLAEAIHPEGRDWHVDHYGDGWQVNGAGTVFADTHALRADAEFIAAANPATILRLIKELRKADAYRALYDHVVEEWNDVADEVARTEAERDALTARLAAVEALVAEWERVQKQNRKALGELARGTSHLLLDTPCPADFRAALAAPTDTTKEN